jgi:hypothetical protein
MQFGRYSRFTKRSEAKPSLRDSCSHIERSEIRPFRSLNPHGTTTIRDAPASQDEIRNEEAAPEALQVRAYRTELVERIARTVPEDGRVELLDGVVLHRSSTPTEPLHTVSEPALCVMAQGAKVVHLGECRYRYDPYRYLLVTFELPMAGEIVEASREEPYLSMIISLDACPPRQFGDGRGRTRRPNKRHQRAGP